MITARIVMELSTHCFGFGNARYYCCDTRLNDSVFP